MGGKTRDNVANNWYQLERLERLERRFTTRAEGNFQKCKQEPSLALAPRVIQSAAAFRARSATLGHNDYAAARFNGSGASFRARAPNDPIHKLPR